jgi:hypothetical protein
MDNKTFKEEFLNTNIFKGLKNMNDGFDSPSIQYFSSADFEIVLNRVKDLQLGVIGIEPWYNGEYFGVLTNDDYGRSPDDPEWYFTAFNDFKNKQTNLVYAATYYLPNFD